jgi:hypothetical protein
MKPRFTPQAEPRLLLASICLTLLNLTREHPLLTWVDLRRIEDRLGINGKALQAGLDLGLARRWLMVEGEPARRVALRDAGAAAASRGAKRRARVTTRKTGPEGLPAKTMASGHT